LVDVDGDGRLDLLTGSDNCCDSEPGFYWFRREADGHFQAQPKVQVKVGEYEPFMPRFRATLADWDGDGRLEVVASLTRITPGLYRSDRDWSLAAEVHAPRPVEGSPDWLDHQPCLTDWDHDGRLDLIARLSTSTIAWHRNLAEAGEPRLGAAQALLSLPDGATVAGLSADDWDGDGWPDLILGYVRIERDETGGYHYTGAGVRVALRRHLAPAGHSEPRTEPRP
jgi:hypothetical protein